MACSVAQQKMGNALFLGVETNTWSLAQFDQAAQFAALHGLDTLIVKVFDGANGGVSGGPDEWYGPIGGFGAVKATIEKHPIKVVPYGFMYGNSKGSVLSIELDLAEKYLNAYGWFVADIESEWDGHVDWATTLNQRLSTNPNLFYASVFADPQPEQNSGAVFQAMAPSVNAWMPQDYDSFLNGVMAREFGGLGLACLMPTVDLINEFGTNDPLSFVSGFPSEPISIWEYQYAVANPSLLDAIIAAVTWRKSVGVVTNSKGMVADITQSYQLSENEMDLCGPWSVASLLFSGFPGKGPIGSAEQIDQWVDIAVGVMGYPNPADFPGVSVADEEWLLKRSGLPYWEITPDIPRITRAVEAGYAVIITAFEPNIKAWSFQSNSWVNAYTWNISANHVLPVGGIDNNGNFICADQLNNAFQGYWPPIYDASRISPSYAAVVQLPWLAPIPNGDPLTWPSGFNAQLGGNSVAVPSGWKDDGTTLTSPNGKRAVLGFRSHIINANPQWASDDWVVSEERQVGVFEESNPAWGAGGGAQIVTNRHMMAWSPSLGKIVEEFMGPEILFLRADRDKYKAQLASETSLEASDQQKISDLNAQITSLQAQLAQGGLTQAEQTAINNAVAALQALQPYVK